MRGQHKGSVCVWRVPSPLIWSLLSMRSFRSRVARNDSEDFQRVFISRGELSGIWREAAPEGCDDRDMDNQLSDLLFKILWTTTTYRIYPPEVQLLLQVQIRGSGKNVRWQAARPSGIVCARWGSEIHLLVSLFHSPNTTALWRYDAFMRWPPEPTGQGLHTQMARVL